MQTPKGTPPNMVAVGPETGPGTAAHSAISQTGCLMPHWAVRTGRCAAYALWEDALNDLLPTLSLKRDSLYEQPPERPNGSRLDVNSLSLWKGAVEQFQYEGTMLFNAVRPSIVLDGPWAMQDLRRIAAWKRDGVKDGRALVRWALSFSDRSSLASQMQLVSDINDAKLSTKATQFDMSEHVSNLWEMWLELSNSDRGQPASFFRQLLISMPTEPECPVVHVRRWLVELLDKGESPLLINLDGDSGLFAKMVTFGASLGMKDSVAPAQLTVLRDVGDARGGVDNTEQGGKK